MMLYVDDDTLDPALILALRRAGHDVRTPAEAGLAGAKDAAHFRRAIREGRALLSRNYDDFEKLHELVVEAQGLHSGVLIVRFDRQKQRFLKPHEFVRTLRKLESAGAPIADEFTVLNHWQ
jgi:hypothetical protein